VIKQLQQRTLQQIQDQTLIPASEPFSLENIEELNTAVLRLNGGFKFYGKYLKNYLEDYLHRYQPDHALRAVVD